MTITILSATSFVPKIESAIDRNTMANFIEAVFNCSATWRVIYQNQPPALTKLPEINILRSKRGVFIGPVCASDRIVVDKKMTMIRHKGVVASINARSRQHLCWFFGYTATLALDPAVNWDVDGLLAALVRELLNSEGAASEAQIKQLDAIIERATMLRHLLKSAQGMNEKTDTIVESLAEFLNQYLE